MNACKPQAASVLNYRATSPLPSQNFNFISNTSPAASFHHLKESLSFQLLRPKVLEPHVILNVSFITKSNFCCSSPEQLTTVQTFLAPPLPHPQPPHREQPILVRMSRCLGCISASFNWFCCYPCPSTSSDLNKTQVKKPGDAVLQPAAVLISVRVMATGGHNAWRPP